MNEEEKQAIEFMNNIEYKQVNSDEFYDKRDILINLIDKQQKEIEKLKRNNQLIINEIVNKANTYYYSNKITAGINKPSGIAYVTLVKLLEEINRKLGE